MKLKRNYYILKGRLHVWRNTILESILTQLAKWGLVEEHKKSYNLIKGQTKPKSAPDIVSQRFVYNVSYVLHKVEFIEEYWFETKKKKKRIHTVYENHHEENRLSCRLELKSFYAHFSHKCRMWVHSNSTSTVTVLYKDSVPNLFPKDSNLEFKHHTCDFSKCRFAFEMSLSPEQTLEDIPREVILESFRVLGDRIANKIPEINKTLTGAENDGDLMSPSKCPLADNLVCRECSYPVFSTNSGRHIYECIHHGEVDHTKIDRIDPKAYEEILSNCLTELEWFCECPQD